MKAPAFVLAIAGILAAVACQRPAARESRIDAQLASEIARIKAIDNHAHPVRPVAEGEKPDDEYDALPVESLERSSEPVRMRSGSAELMEARRELFHGDKASAIRSGGQNYAVRI